MRLIYRSLGILFISLGILCNEYALKSILHLGSPFDSVIKSVFLIIFELLSIAFGYHIIKKGKTALHQLLTVFLSLFGLLVFVECILSLQWFDDLTSESPAWIPAKFKNRNNELNLRHYENSKNNEFGFNDADHSLEKSPETDIRIAILGDSFIWGTGVPDSAVWTRKLQSRFAKQGVACEILNWGKPGWSTRDEFNFLQTNGIKYQFDLLIFAFAVNDPVMDGSGQRLFITRDGVVERIVLHPISILFPNSVSSFTDIVNNFFAGYFDFGYVKWLEKKVYSTDNLRRYSLMIKDIARYCNEKNIEVCFMMTPENHSPLLEQYFNVVSPILEKEKISYLNLFPIVKSDLGHLTKRQLWANPADGHPGDLVTDLYAKYAFAYVVKNQSSKIVARHRSWIPLDKHSCSSNIF